MAASDSAKFLIEQAYTAYYRRPAETVGLDFWAEKLDAAGGDLTKVIDNFVNSTEAKVLYGSDFYGESKDAVKLGAMIDTVYDNLLGGYSQGDPNKQAYIDQFTAGTQTAGSIVVKLLSDAQAVDPSSYWNKVWAAVHFSNTVDPGLDNIAVNATYDDRTLDFSGDTLQARNWLAGIKGTSAESSFSEAAIEQAIKSHEINIAKSGDPFYVESVPTYSLAADVDRVVEGNAVTFSLVTHQVAAGTQLSYHIQGGGITAQDFAEGLSGHFTVGSDGTTAVTLHPVADGIVEGNETFVLSLDNGKASAQSMIVDPAPTGVSVTLTQSASTVNETAPNNTVTYTVTLAKEAPTGGLSIPYTLSGTATATDDYTGSASTGTIAISAGQKTGTFTLTTVEDHKTEGTETISVKLGALPSGYVLSDSGTVSTRIIDTSLTPTITDVSLDGKGADTAPATLDASTGEFNFTDAATVANNVLISGFGADDKITISGATAADYAASISSNAAGDVTIAYNNSGTLNQIVLTGVATTGAVFSVDSFNALPVGDLLFV